MEINRYLNLFILLGAMMIASTSCEYLQINYYPESTCTTQTIAHEWILLDHCNNGIVYRQEESVATDNSSSIGLPISSSSSLLSSSSSSTIVKQYICLDTTKCEKNCLELNTITPNRECLLTVATKENISYEIVVNENRTYDNEFGNCWSFDYQTNCTNQIIHMTEYRNNIVSKGYKINCTNENYYYYSCLDIDCTMTTRASVYPLKKCLVNSNKLLSTYMSYIPKNTTTPVPSRTPKPSVSPFTTNQLTLGSSNNPSSTSESDAISFLQHYSILINIIAIIFVSLLVFVHF
ncbi:hypothetical protein DFA_10248 [Cavenderia fasciculata]|uniref:Uncharacterized protein n=1 Tax=Cavenderia fasciculata TaxID=261658 RepID=F4Q9P4_CACFS|nr:uncharacterized protein DFA_10248 [Cavenderia fasciculata]EGG15413.1 hypothetical protein DFA_10248 [Cavenderia fasciculata]|eukprot:XP_004354155.1 hypothetical protein DFA_10248 [Cavenderia fasciculata]